MIPGEHSLTCIKCGGGLRHDVVHVLFRRAEDGDGTITTCTPGEVRSRDSSNPQDFNGRRDSIEICFACEVCGSRQSLKLVQHKGQTLIGWTE